MSQPCGPAVAAIYLRARDPYQTGTPHPNVRALLAYLQIIINQATGAVIYDSPLTLQPRLPTYGVSGNGLGYPEGIRDDTGRDLDPLTDTATLRWINERWWRETAGAPRSWLLCGLDLILIHPAPVSAITARVRHRGITGPLNNDADLLECPDEDIRLLLLAGEALLDLKSRDLPSCQIAWDNFLAELKVSQGVRR